MSKDDLKLTDKDDKAAKRKEKKLKVGEWPASDTTFSITVFPWMVPP